MDIATSWQHPLPALGRGKTSRLAPIKIVAGMVYAPVKGWLAWVADEVLLAVRDGSDRVEAGPGGDGIFDPISISATAYANQRLTLMSPASLFDHEGNGHQHKINTAADNDTASLLFQTGYSGRAEFGTTGDDDFHVEV